MSLDKRRDFSKGPQRNVRTESQVNDPPPSCTMMHSSSGNFVLTSSRASFQAQDPMSDTILSEVDGTHAFVVVMNADFTARGQSYLSRNLFRESLRLDSSVDTIMVASPGLWQEVSLDSAAQRLMHYKRTLSWEGLDASVLAAKDACRLQHSQSATSVEAYSRQQPRARARSDPGLVAVSA
ncbi:hypothetical protein WJX73_003738 [Symbiochloris irregularis]|uniref:Uncharacterized protein n=1 Tax=Symbiochloris irregularis TaxID=706552 RepID=A0AAW1PFN1_9CHLO